MRDLVVFAALAVGLFVLGWITGTWQVLHDGAALTSFAAEPGEAPASVKEKILGWLEANQSRPAMDVGRQ